MNRDLYNCVKAEIGFQTATVNTANVNGEIVDTLGFESGKVVLLTGAVSTGDVSISKIEESDASDMTGATDIPAVRLLGSPSAVSTANTVAEQGFVCTKRYVRVVLAGGNIPSLTATAVVELGNPHVASVR